MPFLNYEDDMLCLPSDHNLLLIFGKILLDMKKCWEETHLIWQKKDEKTTGFKNIETTYFVFHAIDNNLVDLAILWSKLADLGNLVILMLLADWEK